MSEAVNEVLSTFEMFFSEYRAAVAMMRVQFTTVITDKSIPLTERWELFKKAPDELKEKSVWIVSLKSLDEACGGEASWYDDFHKERHETVDLDDLVSDIQWYIDRNQTGCKNVYDFYIKNPAKLDDLKEEILSMNLQSFVYDW